MKNGDFQVGIVGLGGMGGWHCDLITNKLNHKYMSGENKGIDGIDVAGIFDIDAKKGENAIAHGINSYASLDDLLADEAIDIVLCATPNDDHKEIVIKALRAGKNVVCEKPATISLNDLQEMIDVANECGKLFTVHQNRRWDADFLTIKKLYDEKTLGEVFEIQSRVQGCRGIPGDWRGKKEKGGGMLFDWGIHIIDQITMLVPEKITSVYATLQHITNLQVDDGFRMILTFESGMRALLEVTTSSFLSHARWHVLGVNGSAEIRDFNSECEIVRVTDTTKNDAIPIVTSAGLTKTMAPRTDETTKYEKIPQVYSDIKVNWHSIYF